jgi:DNA-binding SARP family transcriptional activator/tetratricopeptide (TPR) repeat protein
MARLSLSLLGPFRATLDGEPIARFESDKVRALLAYLAAEADRPHRREALVGLLWPDWPEAAARRNLSHALANLRRAIGDDQAAPPFLLITSKTIEFNRAADYYLDVKAFSHQLSAISGRPSGDALLPISNLQPLISNPQSPISILQSAVDLYDGSFLEGFSLKDCPAFDDWVLLTRERLQSQALAALQQVAMYCEQRGAVDLAVGYTRRQVELEPWREEAQRQLMRLLALSGQRSAALAQYEACCRHLRAELGVEPEPETTALYARISNGTQDSKTGKGVPRIPDFLLPPSAHPLPKAPAALFVARERELAALDGYLNQALAGQGGVVFVTGGAGRGKTALLEEFARLVQIQHPGLIVASGNCNAFVGVGDPYLPFRQILGLLAGEVEAKWASGAISRDQALHLWALLPHTIEALVNSGPDLIDVFISGPALSNRAAEAMPDADWSAQLETLARRKMADQGPTNLMQSDLFAQYTKVLQILARQKPLLLVLDDLQWADNGSINLLFYLGRQLAGHRILIVGAYRPDEVALGRAGKRHPLEAMLNEFESHFGNISIDLRQAEGQQFVESLLDATPNRLSSGFKEALFHLTEGHALFTIELLRAMQDRGDLIQDEMGYWVEARPLAWKTFPPRIEGVIAERIARLPAAHQETLKIASVEGEDFTAEVVAQVQAVDGQALVRLLSGTLDKQYRLVTSQGGRRLETQVLSRYRFRHILFQRYLYNSLDEAERVYLHEAVGNTLERLYGNQADEVAVELARHFQMAQLTEKAIAYLQKAGEKAVRSYADYEAIHFFNEALALLKTLPDTPERAKKELSLQTALGSILLATKGFAALEVEQAFNRARELCSQVGETPQLFPLLHGLYRYYQVRAEIQTTRELSDQIMQLTRRQEDASLLLPAELTLGLASFFAGEFIAAQRQLDYASTLYDPRHRQEHVALFGQDALATCQAHAALTLWYLGYPDRALEKSKEAVASAQELLHPFTTALTLIYAGWLRQLRREALLTQGQAEAATAMCADLGFVMWVAMGTIFKGWSLLDQNEAEIGIAEICRGLADYHATGAELEVPYFLALLAEGYGKIGQAEKGLATLGEALERVAKSGECNYEAELHRVKGELLHMQGEAAQAEACFRQAVDVARRQGSKSLELRAATSLARLWRQAGQVEAARSLLAGVFNWFNEGFDTADLRDARQLLEALA